MKTQRAFTLIELSLVLVILGLLAGGIVAGKSLIRSANLRSITSQHGQFISAVTAFKDKYNFFPGDLPTATDYWGAVNADPATCRTNWSASTDPKLTCNGDGDGIVAVADGSTSIEGTLLWQHLSNAQMLDGGYGPLTPLPQGRVNKTQWTAGYYSNVSGGNYFAGTYEHVFALGVPNEVTPVLKPTEAWNIDTKIDDGKPALGNFMVRGDSSWSGPGDAVASCTTATSRTDVSASYKTEYNELACSPLFTRQF